MPTLHLPLGRQPQPQLFAAARSTASDMGPIGEDLTTLAFGDSSEGQTGGATWSELPPVCLVTGEKDQVTFRKVKFSWFPRWVLLLAFVPAGSLLLAGIAALILNKHAEGELPFTDRGWRQWRVARMITPLSIFLALSALVMGLSYTSSDQSAAATLAWVTMIGAPLALYLGLQRNRMVAAARITDTEIALQVPSEAAARAILDRLHPGGMVAPGMLFGAAR